MNLELEFSYRAEVKMLVTVGPGSYGNRLYFEVVSGSFEGKRLNGKMLTGGGDWLLAARKASPGSTCAPSVSRTTARSYIVTTAGFCR